MLLRRRLILLGYYTRDGRLLSPLIDLGADKQALKLASSHFMCCLVYKVGLSTD